MNAKLILAALGLFFTVTAASAKPPPFALLLIGPRIPLTSDIPFMMSSYSETRVS